MFDLTTAVGFECCGRWRLDISRGVWFSLFFNWLILFIDSSGLPSWSSEICLFVIFLGRWRFVFGLGLDFWAFEGLGIQTCSDRAPLQSIWCVLVYKSWCAKKNFGPYSPQEFKPWVKSLGPLHLHQLKKLTSATNRRTSPTLRDKIVALGFQRWQSCRPLVLSPTTLSLIQRMA